MKYVLILILLLPFANALQIHEVYYDPINTESGGEAVVLYADEAINLSEIIVKTESSDEDATLPNVLLQQGRYFLIADEGWSEQKDGKWNEADYEEAITLSNTNGGVAIVKNGVILDAVGWGNPEEIEEGLYEGNPTIDVTQGTSLLRKKDTQNNEDDFVESIPELKNSLSVFEENTSQKVLHIERETFFTGTEVEQVSLAPLVEGKVMLLPGRIRELNITVHLRADTEPPLQNYSLISQNGTSYTYKKSIALPFSTPPGVYEETIPLDDEEILSYEVLPLVSITLDTKYIKTNTSFIQGDGDFSTSDAPTIQNSGNVPISLFLKGTELEGPETLSMSYDIQGKKGVLTSEYQSVDFILDPAAVVPLSIHLPSGREGTYKGSILVGGEP